MPGEFYIEGKVEKLDITDIKDLISQIQTSIVQVQNDVSQVVLSSGKQQLSMDFWSETFDEAEVEIDAAGETKDLPPITVEKIPSGCLPRSSSMGKTKHAANCPKGVPAPVNVGELGKNFLLEIRL